MELLICSEVNIIYSIIRMIPLTAMTLSETVKVLCMVTVMDGIRNTLYHQPKFLVFISCRVTSKILGIGSAERSWGDV